MDLMGQEEMGLNFAERVIVSSLEVSTLISNQGFPANLSWVPQLIQGLRLHCLGTDPPFLLSWPLPLNFLQQEQGGCC